MQKKNLYILFGLILVLFSCTVKNYDVYVETSDFIETEYSGQIYLYGEKHGVEEMIAQEFELWNKHYKNGMRHLFIESAYFTAQYLNLWMQEEDDTKLNEIYSDWEGTASHNAYILVFYKKIKEFCPETIFHGTDIGHQYFSTGERYLNYLDKNGLSDSREYKVARSVIEQGYYYYHSDMDGVYRENKMVENFIRELNFVDQNDIMGIYGAAHINIKKLDFTKSIPCMANQLNSVYKEQIITVDLSKR